MPADGISLPFTISGNVGSSRPDSSLVEIMNTPPPIQKATFCRTYASAKSRHWSGRAVRWSTAEPCLVVGPQVVLPSPAWTFSPS